VQRGTNLQSSKVCQNFVKERAEHRRIDEHTALAKRNQPEALKNERQGAAARDETGFDEQA